MIELFEGIEGVDHFLAGTEIRLRHFVADFGGEGIVGVEVHGFEAKVIQLPVYAEGILLPRHEFFILANEFWFYGVRDVLSS